MKKCLIFIITLMLALLPCAQAMATGEAQRHISSLGYSVELSEYWFQLSPDTVGAFAQLLEVTEAEVPELMGFSSDYITNFDGRTRDAYYNIGGNSAGGNVIIRRLPKSESDGFGTLEGHRSAMEQELIPMMESIGATILLMPEITTIGARDFVANGFNLMDTNAYQYTTISAAGPWYELTFTEVTEGDALSILESIAFEGEDAPAATPEPAANQDAEYSLAIAGEFDEANPPYAGEWREFEEAGLRVYLPDSLVEEPLSDADIANGYRYCGVLPSGNTLSVFISEPNKAGFNQTQFINDMTGLYSSTELYLNPVGDFVMATIYQPEDGYFENTLYEPESNRLFSIVVFANAPENIEEICMVASSIQPIPEAPAYSLNVPGAFDEDNPPYDGSWVEFAESGMRIYLPDTLTSTEITEEDIADDIYYYGYAQDSGNYMILQYESDASDWTFENVYANYIGLCGAGNVRIVQPSGQDMICAYNAESGYFCYILLNEETGMFFDLTIFPSAATQENADFFGMVAASMQPIPDVPVFDLTVPDTFDEDNPPYDGSWVEFAESGMRIYMPSAYEPLETTEENIAESLYFYGLTDDGGTCSVMQYSSDPAVDYTENFMNHYSAQVGEDNIRASQVNGMDLIAIYWPETGYFNYFVVNSEMQMFFDLFISCANEPDMEYLNAIASSIQPIPEPPVDPTAFEPFDEANPPYAGSWMTLEDSGLRVYMPDSVSAIDTEDWLLFSGKMQDGTTFHINASTVFAEGLSIEDTFGDFKAMYYGMDADVYMISIGDIPVIIADDRETGICTYYVFNCDPDFNRWFSINFDYETAADFAAYNVILSSLQHVETQAAPEPTAGTSNFFGKNPKKPLNKDAKIVASQEEGLRFASDEFKAMLNLALGKEAGAPVYAEELAGIEEVYITGGRLYFDEAAFNEISGDEPLVWMPVDDISHFANLHKLGIANVGVESASGLEELGLLELAFVYCEFAEGLVLPEMFIEEEFGVMYCGLEDLSLIQNVSSVQLLLAKNSLRSLQGLNVKPEVEYLVLSDNQLTNLAGIEAFPNVSLLYADNNQLDSLAGISALSSLTYLNVQNNKITSLEPLAGSAKLGRLLAAGNMISSLDSLAGLTSLTSLDIQDNLVSSLEPLRGLPITYLYASGNQISSLEPLAEGLNLKTLYLSGNRISSIDVLAGHVQLRNLDMSNNSISSIEALSGLTYLRNVDVSGNSISSLEPLSGKEYLVVLNASGNKISSLEPLAGMKNLDYLLVAHNRISSLEPLYEYGVGKALDVSYNQFTSIEWMRETRSALMDVSGNPLTSLAPLDYISSGIYLYVADLANVSDWSYTERLKYVYHYTMQEHMQETDGQSIDPFRNIRVENWY